VKRIDYAKAARVLGNHANPAKASIYRGFFKDTSGEIFLGVTTPRLRTIAREFWAMPLADVRRLMQSRIHEERSLANEILRLKFHRGAAQQQTEVFNFYVRNRCFISSWDCVDGSAPYIVGCYLLHRDKKLLYQLAASPRIWDRRIAIVSSLCFIRGGKINDTLKLATILLHDEEDLIHKATGWMLREVGKQDLRALKTFLDAHSGAMPRTMLRYAIERFPPGERKKYLGRSENRKPKSNTETRSHGVTRRRSKTKKSKSRT
jgi:3-methyladenine DNA glycosylase AlkD